MCRLQVDLVDMHYRPDGPYKYICHARDHFSKFSWSSALPSKEAKEVAGFLFELFTAFGLQPSYKLIMEKNLQRKSLEN